MKVITKETLNSLRENAWAKGHDNEYVIYDYLLEGFMKELDTLTVTRLRPMSEAPHGEYILVAYENENDLFMVFYDGREFLINKHHPISAGGLCGFIPMPRYEPEKL